MSHVDAGRGNVGDVSVLVLGSNEPLELKSFVQSFQKIVPSQRWVFCRSDVAQTSRQLWTATTVSNRNTERGTAQARTLDAEFLRVLAGYTQRFRSFQTSRSTEQVNIWMVAPYSRPDNIDELKIPSIKKQMNCSMGSDFPRHQNR